MSTPGDSEQFDLARFVLGYLEHAGGVVAPPAYGVHEVLLPDDAGRAAVGRFLPAAGLRRPRPTPLRCACRSTIRWWRPWPKQARSSLATRR